MRDPNHSFQLRQLPLPAKWVLTLFLITVGLGYVSAMLQLHFKHASPGQPMPTPADVVAHFAGADWPPVAENKDANQAEPAKEPIKKEAKVEPKAAAPVKGGKVAGVKIKTLIETRCGNCHGPDGEQSEHSLMTYAAIEKYLKPSPAKSLMHKLVTGPEDSWSKSTSMSQAFFRKSDEWKDIIAERGEATVRAERKTEQAALAAWLEADAPEDAYTADAFPLPQAIRKDPFTKDFQTEATDRPEPAAGPAGAPEKPKEKKKPTAKSRQTSVESLTQSTHAHLLSFAVLWTCTGLIFAFTSYPLWLRLGVAPVVLLAQVADVLCWWLARLPGVGPYFALAIMGTGAIVGLGLGLQIVLSLFNMYGSKGKAILFLLFVAGGVGLATAFLAYFQPLLQEEKQQAGVAAVAVYSHPHA